MNQIKVKLRLNQTMKCSYKLFAVTNIPVYDLT